MFYGEMFFILIFKYFIVLIIVLFSSDFSFYLDTSEYGKANKIILHWGAIDVTSGAIIGKHALPGTIQYVIACINLAAYTLFT